MSSRALRKLQNQQQQSQAPQVEDNQGEDSEEEQAPVSSNRNVFDLLDAAEDNGSEEDESDLPIHSEVASNENPAGPSDVTQTTKKTKKKKNKNKVKVSKSASPNSKPEAQLDEIDLALRSLSTKPPDDAAVSVKVTIDEANAQLYRLLAVESKHLNALNEMKRLFGNVVMENEDDNAGAPRRRGRGSQQLDLGGALAGRNNLASRGQGLAGLALRRNPFILGKEEWPKATSGGLGMEMVEKLEDGTTEFRFVHNTIYQDVQRQFEVCVESMDPQRMITMLQYNPYHVSTLLQVSEIAKQQGDHSVSGDLLERALFSFGRSVHSSFTAALSEGKARLDFRRPENREFWLAAWRYTNNLGQKGTWRTAYEWAKLILSLDPEGDPYSMGLVVDQLALRGGQSEHFLQLSQCSFFKEVWRKHANIQVSSTLAQNKLKQAQKSRETLAYCIRSYPWIFAHLFQALNIDHIPPSIWGKSSSSNSERQKFDSECYVYNAKDLWNTPEAVSLLVEGAESVDSVGENPQPEEPITLEEARHIILSGVPSLLNLLPRSFTTRSSSSSDPLPPDDNLPSYNPTPPADHLRGYASPFETDGGLETPPNEGTPNARSPIDDQSDLLQAQNWQGAAGFLRRFIPWMAGEAPAPDPAQIQNALEDEQRREAEQGVPPELTAERGARVMELLNGLLRRGGRRGQDRDDSSASGSRDENNAPSPELTSHLPAQVEDASDEDSTPIPSDVQELPANQIGPSDPYDDESNQRWLAGQGMLRLKEFADHHGTKEDTWPANAGQEIVREYAKRMMQLRQQRSRTFLMNFTLPQGTNVEVKGLIEREMERLR